MNESLFSIRDFDGSNPAFYSGSTLPSRARLNDHFLKTPENEVYEWNGSWDLVATLGGSSYTDQDAKDAVGGSLSDSSTIDLGYNGTLFTASVVSGSIGNTQLASGLDATKLADGTISNTELQYLNGVTSNLQTQLGNKQPLNTDLTSLSSINNVAGFLKTTGTPGLFTVDLNNYVNLLGSYSNPSWITSLAWNKITSTPTTLSGYGITDAQPIDADLTAIAALTGTSGFLKTNGANTWSVDANTYLTANQSITWTATGDVSGSASGTTSITPSLTVNRLNGVSLPTFTASGGFLRYTGTGTNTWTFDSTTYLPSSQTFTVIGDVSGSGPATAINVGLGYGVVAGSQLTSNWDSWKGQDGSISEDTLIGEAIGFLDTRTESLSSDLSTINNKVNSSSNRFYSFEMDGTEGNIQVNAGGTVTWNTASVSGHPGILTITTGTSQYSQARHNYGQTAQTGIPFYIDYLQETSWIFRMSSVSNNQFWFGWFSTGTTGDQTQDNSVMAFSSNNGSLQLICKKAGSSSTANSASSISANTWYKLTLTRNSATSISMKLNNTVVATVTSNVPSTTACGIGGRIMTLETASKSIDLDYWEIYAVNPHSRY